MQLIYGRVKDFFFFFWGGGELNILLKGSEWKAFLETYTVQVCNEFFNVAHRRSSSWCTGDLNGFPTSQNGTNRPQCKMPLNLNCTPMVIRLKLHRAVGQLNEYSP